MLWAVGLRNALNLIRETGAPVQYAHKPLIRSPWATGQLSTITFPPELLASDFAPVTRAEAIAVPAMSRARDLICTTIARWPLEALRADVPLPPSSQPFWMFRSDGPVTPLHRMIWTVDDLLFSGWALWAVDRGAEGQILAADRVPIDMWQFDSDGTTILVDGATVAPDQVLLFPGPHEGLLMRNGATLRTAGRLERAAATRAANPIPLIEVHQTVDIALEDSERDVILRNYGQAVLAANGGSTGIAYTSFGLEGKAIGANGDGPAALVESRNYSAVTVAQICGVPAAMLDATSNGASLTYETTSGRRLQFVDEIQAYSDPIAARLSSDDVVPRGQRVAFSTEQTTTLTPSPTGAPVLD